MGRCTTIGLALATTVGGEVMAQCSPFEITEVQAPDTVMCQGDSLSFNIVGFFVDSVHFQWQQLLVDEWQAIVNDTLDHVVVSPSSSTFYRCIAICSDDTLVSDTIGINVHALPALSASADPTGPYCGSATTTLLALGDASFSWSPPDGLATTEGPEVPCVTTTTTTYTVTATSVDGCVRTDSVHILVLEPPTVLIPEDLLICSTDSEATLLFVLTGAQPFDLTLNTPSTSIDFTGYAEDSLLIDQLQPGAYSITALSDTGCAATAPSDTVFVQTADPQEGISAVAIDALICEGNSCDLVGNDPAPFMGFWSIVPGSPTGQIIPAPGSDSTAVFIPDTVGTYQLQWTITGLNCPDVDTIITVEVIGLAEPTDAGEDMNVCLGGAITLSGSDPFPGTGTWSLISGPEGTFADPHDPGTLFTANEPGTFTLQWSVANAPCFSAPDNVIITVSGPDASPAIIGLEGSTVCDGEYQTLIIPDSGTVNYTWQCPHWEQETLTGGLVTAHWEHPGGEPGEIPTTITLITGGVCPDTMAFAVQLSAASASCPRGIIHFEPHGLAVLDPLAAHYQWGRLMDGAFVADPARTDQTTFDAAHITGCDPAPYYVVRTSITGSQCWSTTLLCATPETLERECPTEGLAGEGLQFRAYPNPSDGAPVTVEVIGDGSPLSIRISDTGGRSLATAWLPLTGYATSVLDVQHLRPGIYLLHAQNATYQRTIKLVIDRTP